MIRELLQHPDVLSGGLNLTQPWLDVPDVGASIIAYGYDEAKLKEFVAILTEMELGLADKVSTDRGGMDPALEGARKSEFGKPCVVCNAADSAGAGAPGDNAATLAYVLEHAPDITFACAVEDAPAVRKAHELGVGKTATFRIGGTKDPKSVCVEAEARVVGLREGSAAEPVLREVYASQLAEDIPFLVMDLATAELVKVAANAFLATKISFINAVAEVCEASGGDVTLLADAIGYDDRIGRKFLGAGLGFGGGCLPKDIRAFMARAGELGADQALSFLREVDTINMRQRDRVIQLAKQELGGSLLGRRVAVLGAAFKPNSDDVRDSPALNVAGQLSLAGASVDVYDPFAMDNARKVFPTLTYANSLDEALAESELVILATEWQEFREMDPKRVAGIVGKRNIIDARNVLDPKKWQAAGWTIRALGRSL